MKRMVSVRNRVPKICAVIAALAAVVGLTTYAGVVRGQDAPAASAPSGGTRVAVIDIAKLLKNYSHAKESGEILTKTREGFVVRVKELRDQITAQQERLKKGEATKDQVEAEVTKIQRQIQDIDRQAQREITKAADQSVERIYTEVQYIIKHIANAHGYDLVLCYPGTSEGELKDDGTPAVSKSVIARMMLQTPAAMPFYVNPKSNIDITDTVIATINPWWKKNGATMYQAGGN